MSPAHFLCEVTSSTLTAISLTPRLPNSSFSLEARPSSVVHTGVKSFGCENKIPQLLPSHWWKAMGPSVDSWLKSGAMLPMCRLMVFSSVSHLWAETITLLSRLFLCSDGCGRDCHA